MSPPSLKQDLQCNWCSLCQIYVRIPAAEGSRSVKTWNLQRWVLDKGGRKHAFGSLVDMDADQIQAKLLLRRCAYGA
jgi:hypothetical protein